MSFPGLAHQLVTQYENIHMRNITQRKQVIFRIMYLYMYTYMHITIIIEKRTINEKRRI